MFPSLAFDDSVDELLADAVSFGQNAVRCQASGMVGMDLANVGLSQLGVRMVFTIGHPFFAVSVACVVTDGAEEDVVRIAARRVVAFVAGEQAV